MNYAPEITAFLRDGGYSSAEDWARDSDYHETDGVWYTEDGQAVDIEGCIEGAMEASGWI